MNVALVWHLGGAPLRMAKRGETRATDPAFFVHLRLAMVPELRYAALAAGVVRLALGRR